MNNSSDNSIKKISSGTTWEKIAGFSRALRIENHIYVAGTTASDQNGVVHKGDVAKQMHFVLDKIEKSIKDLSGTLEDVVRTRIYVKDINDWEVVARIHGEVFSAIKPVNTLVQATLVGDCLVEVEAEAIVFNKKLPS
jgi:enamine deaminase RidA (YjgF/YER057c/UK114 family)